MKRQEKVLKHIKKAGIGVEIGPSHNPIAPKKSGYNVHIIDHMSREELVKKYTGHGLNLSRIEDVDFVWQGQSYAELLGHTNYYDWIIASHVIEHAPDLIGFLNDCTEILNENGVISLVIPDKRYCFDHYRPITGLAQLIDSHHQQAKIHSPGAVAEYMLNVVARAGNIAWSAHETGNYTLVHSLNDAQRGMTTVIDDQSYIDVHAWCFVPHSFRLLMHDLFELGLISVREIEFYPTDGCEFYMTLGKHGKGISQSRLALLEAIDDEIIAGINGTPKTWQDHLTSQAKATKAGIKNGFKKALSRTKYFIRDRTSN